MQAKVSSHYAKQVRAEFTALFAKHSAGTAAFQGALIACIAHCFHLTALHLSNCAKAKIIVGNLIRCCPYTAELAAEHPLSQFLERFIPQKREEKKFLIAVLYGLYYGDVDLAQHTLQNQVERFDFFLLQILAETVSRATLVKALKALSLDNQVFLICYVVNRYREGSFYILNALMKIFSKKMCPRGSVNGEEKLCKLIANLRSHYFDSHYLYSLLVDREEVDALAVAEIFDALQAYALEETDCVHKLLQEVIKVMVDSPVRVFEELEEMRNPQSSALPSSSSARQRAEMQRENLRLSFKSFLAHDYTSEQLCAFFKVFGLRNHLPPLIVGHKERPERSLLDKLQYLHHLFSHPTILLQVDGQEILNLFSFVHNFSMHLEAFCFHPAVFQSGFSQLACAMPTKGKSLERGGCLASLLQSINALERILNAKLNMSSDAPQGVLQSDCRLIGDFCMVVFDQSRARLFAKNQLFIQKLMCRYKCKIMHISEDQALELAAKIGVKALLDTTGRGEMGYGGARNCVFLLTAVLRHAFKLGKRSFHEVLQMDDCALRALFDQFTLGGAADSPLSPCGDTLWMIDDDMEIPLSHLFSYALFAGNFSKEYAYSGAFGYGRGTKYHIYFHYLQDVFNHPLRNFMTTQWLQTTTPALMSEYVGKPKVGLNLPLGSEEAHLKLNQQISFFLTPSYHLAGTRYPTRQIPINFFVGLEEYLKKFLPYALGVELTVFLVDATNSLGRCILPWKDKNAALSFSCLRSVFKHMGDPALKVHMQRRFWKNVHDLLHSMPCKGKLSGTLHYLCGLDVDAYLASLQKGKALELSECNSLKAIGELYKLFKKDALVFSEFIGYVIECIDASTKPVRRGEGESLPLWHSACIEHSVDFGALLDCAKEHVERRHGIALAEYPLTGGFWLLAHAVGAGEFCDIIGRLISEKEA